MPILIILLFYINDLVRIKRYYSQTEFVAQQMANILQNISQKREDKRITYNDLRYAFVLALHTIYPGTSVFYQNQNKTPLPWINVYYVKGSNNGTASIIWHRALRVQNKSTPNNITVNGYNSYNKFSASSPLNIALDEYKIVIEPSLLNTPSFYSDKDLFGLHLVNLKRSSSGWAGFFQSYISFTPKPGLFTETAPS